MTERTCIGCHTDITTRHGLSRRCKACQKDAERLAAASAKRAHRARRIDQTPPTMMRCHFCSGVWSSVNIIGHMVARHEIPPATLRLSIRQHRATIEHVLTVRATAGGIATTSLAVVRGG